MENVPDGRTRFRAILVVLAVIATVVFNFLASAGYVNGRSTASISAKYETVMTPAEYAFTIWGLIYLGLLAFAVYQVLPANIGRVSELFRTLLIAGCVLNCAWLYFCHQERVGVSLAMIVMLAAVLGLMCYLLRGTTGVVESLLTKGTFGVYFGWVACAALVNVMIWLQYSEIITPPAANRIGVVLILVAAASGVIVRWRIENFFFPIAVAWALSAIGVRQSGNTAIVIATALGTVTALITAGTVVTTLKDASTE